MTEPDSSEGIDERRDRVARELEGSSMDESFFRGRSTLGAAATDSSWTGRSPGDEIGDFRLVGLLGRGGMGQVWEAEQLSMGRNVALKLLHSHVQLAGDSVERFQREARAGGRLTHNGIVQIFSVGEFEGVHFMAQEMVEGSYTLADSLAEFRQETEVGNDYYPEIGRLFAEISEALAHAHENGVVHRDIKPSNILIGPDDKPKVADFGLALVEDLVGLSRTGEIMGTPLYMSPEQAATKRINIDHRTDIFSLGATLYEALTLTRPFHGDTSRQIFDQIMSVDPVDPRRLRSRVPDDLAVICLKALEKRRDDRYPSMAEFAEDLRRHLANEPILAQPPTALQRAVKWTRRNPTKSAVSGVAAAAFAVISWLLVENIQTNEALEGEKAKLVETNSSLKREERATATALVALDQEKAKLVETNETLQDQTTKLEISNERLEKKTTEALTFAQEAQRQAEISQAVNDFFNNDMLASVAPSAEAGRGKDVLMREVLDAASEKIGERFEGKPVIEAEILKTIGNTYLALGEYPKSEPHLKRSLLLRTQALGEEDEDTVTSKSHLGALYHSQGQYEEAERIFLEVLDVRRRDLGEDNSQTIESLNNLGAVYVAEGRYPEAEPLYLEALERAVEVLGEDHERTLLTRNNLATLYGSQGRFKEAEPLYLDILERRRSILGDSHPDTILSLSNLGNLYELLGLYTEAEALYEEALEHSRQVYGDVHVQTLRTQNSSAALMLRMGKYEEAEVSFLDVLEKMKSHLGEDHPETLSSLSTLGALYINQGRLQEAEEIFTDALEKYRAVLGEGHPDTILCVNNLAIAYIYQGRIPEAEPLFVLALESAREHLGVGHPDTISAMNNLGSLYKAQAKYDEALPLYVKALEGSRSLLGGDHADTLLCMNNLAGLYEVLGREAEAEPMYVECLEKTRAILGVDHPQTLLAMNNLANLYRAVGRDAEAEALLLEVVEKRLLILGADHHHTLLAQNNLGTLYNTQGRFEEAEPLFREVLAKGRSILGDDHLHTLSFMNNLAALLRVLKNLEEAEPLHVECLKSRRRVLGDDHPDTLLSLHNLIILYQDQRRYEEAEPLARELVQRTPESSPDFGEYKSLLESIHAAGLKDKEEDEPGEDTSEGAGGG